MTALAILGSATSTSLTSRGKSMTTDLPTPIGTKRTVASLAAIVTTGARASVGAGAPAYAGIAVLAPSAPSRAAKLTVRIRAQGDMVSAPLYFGVAVELTPNRTM